MKKYKVGDIIVDPSLDEMQSILEGYEAEWVSIGHLMITKVKEAEDEQ